MALPIPTIDLLSPTAPEEIDAAASTIGFFQVVNHGVRPETMADLRNAVDEFFALPLSTKLRYTPPRPDVRREPASGRGCPRAL